MGYGKIADRVALSSGSVSTCCDSPQAAQCEHSTLCSAAAIVKSYTPQSADLMRLTIELETLGISDMEHGKIAECGGQLGVLGYLL